MHHGSCLCGSVKYHIDGDLSDFGYCHCISCRKSSGSAYGANSGISKSSFHLLDPASYLKAYESSPGKFRVFCSNCGSPVYAYLTKSADLIRIRLGTLDTPFDNHCRAHTFVGEKADWEIIEDDIPQFEQWASKDVLVQVGSRQD